ncbi:MAG: Hsp70 family protein, partial [Vulcanimicrobiota bacterium]
PVLPWERASDLQPVSAVATITRYLEHIIEAWNYSYPEDSLQASEVVLTIPASFDDLARKLTASAAASVGLPVRLLEEPQAAFYSWLWKHRKDWKKRISPGDVVLVCDIGGGTTDFTLIRYREDGELERVAVGDHLMLGGDNLDIALAYLVEPRLPEKLSGLQWGVLRQQCRACKELLLGDEAPGEATVTVPGAGSKLFAAALSTELSRQEVLELVLDGFFPKLSYEDVILKGKARGLKELGLPFETDPAVPRHLSRFLHSHSEHFPTRVLFNGGACAATVVRERLVEVLEGWRRELGLEQPVQELENPEAHLAVARGAAWYGHQRQTSGLVVEGGTARSYYLGLAENKAVCVIPSHTREGQAVELSEPRLKLTVGRQVAFPLFSSSKRTKDQAGELVSIGDLAPLPTLQTVIGEQAKGGQKEVPVSLASEVTPVGTLDIHLRSDDKREYRLEFSVRDGVAGSASADLARQEVEDSRALILSTFNAKPKQLKNTPWRPKNLLNGLEQTMGKPREEWAPVVLRTFWDAYWSVETRRRVDPEFEASWLNGLGFCLRPGFGLPLDEWRVLQLEKLLESWLQFPRDDKVRIQFYVLWRRVAAGLRRSLQQRVWDQIHPHFLPGRKHIKTRNKGNPGKEDGKEMLRAAVSLERIEVAEKVALAETLMGEYTGLREELWLLARLLARRPLDQKAEAIPAEQVTPFIEKVLQQAGESSSFFAQALVNMAQKTGLAERDLDDELFSRVEKALKKAGAAETLLARLRGETDRTQEETATLYGDSLPLGLSLL